MNAALRAQLLRRLEYALAESRARVVVEVERAGGLPPTPCAIHHSLLPQLAVCTATPSR